jgi:hypothetical protein
VIVLCENVHKTFSHKSKTPDSIHWVNPYDNHLLCTLSPTNLLPTLRYMCFLYVSPQFYHIHSNEFYTESSSPCHHQPDCENPHQLQTWICSGIHFIEPSFPCVHSFQTILKYEVDVWRETWIIFPWDRSRLVCDTVVFVSVFWRYDLKTLFLKSKFFSLFFVGGDSLKALGSHGGVGWELRRFY